jgi:hypothetical protein
MDEDEKHSAYGAMIHRQLVEERDYFRQKEHKETLDYAVRMLKRISKCHDAEASIVMAQSALDHIQEMIG